MSELQLLAQTYPKGAFLAVALLFIAMELLYARLAAHDEEHDLAETAASSASRSATSRSASSPAGSPPSHSSPSTSTACSTSPSTARGAWVTLFLGVELCYYAFHRASHRVRWLWATHAVHHSATRFNLSAAIRLGWTGTISGAFVFFLPLAFIGFHPVAIAAVMGLGLLYQFFLHTAFPVSLGPLEWVLNTPAHHRVHHACNDPCLDKNYGNVLIVFDRLFGTFAAPPVGERLRFGLKGRSPSLNPLRIAFGEWSRLARDAGAARGMAAKLKVLFGAP